MESSDVIELNSSDDEAKAPAAKRLKPSPNAMVHIPNQLYDTTITRTVNRHKGVGKLSGAKIRNSTNVNFQSAHKKKPNGRHLQKTVTRPNVNEHVNQKPIHLKNFKINPMSVGADGQLVSNKMLSVTKVEKNILKGHAPNLLTSLPPGITIKGPRGSKNIIPSSVKYMHVNKNFDTGLTKNFGIATVEIDDEGSSAATASPQWYLRPEEQLNKESIEVLNNKEPEPTMIEITIDDSPVKPYIPNELIKQEELFITIEDSPIKLSNEPMSIDAVNNEQDKTKIPSSKKKLGYPEHNEDNVNDISETETASDLTIENKSNNVEQIVENKKYPEGAVTPTDVSEDSTISTALKPNDDVSIGKLDDQQNQGRKETGPENNINKASENTGEFHPIYQKFIDLCFELENSDDMKKIVEKKIKTYYKQVSKEYVESEEFLDMVSVKMSLMKAGPEKMFLYIKDIVDELNIQRKMAKPLQAEIHNTNTEEKITEIYEKDVKYDRRRRRQIRKLEKTIKKLHRAIQKLELQEVDFDDEENSVYLLTERYKERLVRVHAKFCQITNSKMPSEPHIHIQSRPGQPPGPAKRLEKWINRKVPLGTPLPFPDFHDVLNCVREANEEDRLGWNEADIMEEARDLFTRCGRKLQRRRQENEWRLATSIITQQGDPAEDNETLKKKLEENRMEAVKKEADLVNKFADKQAQLRLEGVEIGDKEAEESPEESEDEEINDDSNSLDDKGKRKDRLLRLLEEKSKKSAESGKESECLSQNIDVPENVQKISEENKATENNTTEIESTKTSEDQMPISLNQQITTCSAQNETEAENMENNIVKDNLASNVTSDAKLNVEINHLDTPVVLNTSVQNETEDAENHIILDEDNLANETTCDPVKIDDITEEINKLDSCILLTSSVQRESEDIETQNNMNADGLVIVSTCDAEKIDDITEEINNPDTPNMLKSSVQNETEDAIFQNSMDKDNLATDLTSDTENEVTEEGPVVVKREVKFEYDEHINLISDDSDGDELNLLQKLHSGDDQSSPESSDADESPNAISGTLKYTDSDDDNEENYDVISIENSSYSESESTKDDIDSNKKEITSIMNDVTYDLEEESQDDDRQVTATEALPEDHENYGNEDCENILLASSEDEEDITNKDIVLSKYCGNYVNLKDDEISISETQLLKVGPSNYDETGDPQISQALDNLCDDSSSSSVKMTHESKICSEEVILEDD